MLSSPPSIWRPFPGSLTQHFARLVKFWGDLIFLGFFWVHCRVWGGGAGGGGAPTWCCRRCSSSRRGRVSSSARSQGRCPYGGGGVRAASGLPPTPL